MGPSCYTHAMHALHDPDTTKALASYYTPEGLANTVADWVVRTGRERLLEPSVGGGALAVAAIRRARVINPWANDFSLVCCDVSHAAIAALPAMNCPIDLHVCDFLALKPEGVGSVDAVAMNPPFIRNHALPTEVRQRLRAEFEINGAAGLWVYFLLHAARFLKRGGRMAAIVPASITFSNYGRNALERLCQSFSSVELRRMVDTPAWVTKAEERGALLLAEGYGCGQAKSPDPTSWLASGVRTSDIFAGNPLLYREALLAATPLGAIASMSIGAVTGHNRTFLLSEPERVLENIDISVVRPIVARARHAPGLIVSPAGLRTLASKGEKTWLLSPADIDQRHTGVRARLARISSAQRRGTLWLNKRDPWWRVQLPHQCDAIFTYMNHGAPRLVLAEGELTCTNTLHNVRFKDGIKRPTQIAAALTMISTFGQLSAELRGRVYGGGVLKFELQEARTLPVLPANGQCTLANLRRTDVAWRNGGEDAARGLADRLMLAPIFGERWPEASREMESELLRLRAERLNGGAASS